VRPHIATTALSSNIDARLEANGIDLIQCPIALGILLDLRDGNRRSIVEVTRDPHHRLHLRERSSCSLAHSDDRAKCNLGFLDAVLVKHRGNARKPREIGSKKYIATLTPAISRSDSGFIGDLAHRIDLTNGRCKTGDLSIMFRRVELDTLTRASLKGGTTLTSSRTGPFGLGLARHYDLGKQTR
jgi:hypothetical protein